MAEVRAAESAARRQLTENQHTIQFLEEECRMLRFELKPGQGVCCILMHILCREMAEEFKSRLKLSGGALGESIIRQVNIIIFCLSNIMNPN